MRRPLVLAVAAALVPVAAAGGVRPAPTPRHGAAPWRAPADPLVRARAAGLRPERQESFLHHVHAHLDVYVNGVHERVPAAVGIDVHDPDVRVFPLPDGTKAYGGIAECAKACISPLHTHDDTGILHTESASPVPNRLGQFFVEWGVRLDRRCVGGYCRPTSIRVYVNGKPFTGDPRTIELTNHEEIAIVIGTPPKRIPKKADFSQA